MLNDLRQYFTKKELEIKSDNNLTILEAIIGYQKNADDYIDMLEEDPEFLPDILESGEYGELFETMNVHIFIDLLGSNIYQYIFQSFMDFSDFKLTEIDGVIGYLYDEVNEEFVDITIELPMQVRKYVNKFYKEAQNECYHFSGNKYEFDSYVAETIGFRMYHLNMKNKALARWLRKNYSAHGSFYTLCEQLGFCFENGQFMLMEYTYLEASGFYDKFVEPSIVASSIARINKELKTSRELNYGIVAVVDEATAHNRDYLIATIINILETENEVII